MSSCIYCRNIVNYTLIDKSVFYGCKRYFFYNCCYDCKMLIEDLFLLKIKADKEQADYENSINLQPF